MTHREKAKGGARSAALAKGAVSNPGALDSVQKTEAETAGKKRRVRLLVVDDHPVVRKGICSCLARHPRLEIVGEAGDGAQALSLAEKLTPDIVLMDIDMPQMDGLTVTETMRQKLPDIKVLILSMHSNSEYIKRILQSGAWGYVLKDAPTEDLVQAIETVEAGETFFSPEVARLALDQFVRSAGERPANDLTTREREVLIQITDGLSNKEIASQLGVGVRTVETHRERIMRKLNIHTIAGLTKYAISKGLITLRK